MTVNCIKNQNFRRPSLNIEFEQSKGTCFICTTAKFSRLNIQKGILKALHQAEKNVAKVLDLSGIVGILTSIFLNLLFKISFSGDSIMASIILAAIFLATLLFFINPCYKKSIHP